VQPRRIGGTAACFGKADMTSSIPHHDGSPLYVSNLAPALGDTVRVRLRVPAGYGPLTVVRALLFVPEPLLGLAAVRARGIFLGGVFVPLVVAIARGT
jgi:hypothetical protein